MSVTPGCKQTASAFYSRNQSRLVDMSLTLLAGQGLCHQRRPALRGRAPCSRLVRGVCDYRAWRGTSWFKPIA